MAHPISSISVSRLQVYLACQQLFFEKYINKSGIVVDTKQTALIQGSLTHALLEVRLKDLSLVAQTPLVVAEWLVEVCGLNIAADFEEMLQGKGICLTSVLEYAESLSSLLKRCGPKYEEEDKLRTKDGKILADPLTYPSTAFRQAYDQLNLSQNKQIIDVSAARQHPDFATNDISLCNVVANSLNFAQNFTYPEDFKRTIAIELDLSAQTETPLSIVPGVEWKGYIDWVYETKTGEVVIVDHKTNKAIPNELEVVHHEQLNIYASLYYEIYNVWPNRIGIQHLRSDTLVTAEVDPVISSQIYSYYKEITLDILNPRAVWLRQSPAKTYAGTCVKKFGLSVQVCPLLASCWPNFNPAAIV